MNKTCNATGDCQYRTLGGSMCGCAYKEYCDYQLPKDSRQAPVTKLCDEYQEGLDKE